MELGYETLHPIKKIVICGARATIPLFSHISHFSGAHKFFKVLLPHQKWWYGTFEACALQRTQYGKYTTVSWQKWVPDVCDRTLRRKKGKKGTLKRPKFGFLDDAEV